MSGGDCLRATTSILVQWIENLICFKISVLQKVTSGRSQSPVPSETKLTEAKGKDQKSLQKGKVSSTSYFFYTKS